MNTPAIQYFMIFCIGFFILTALFFLINFFVKRKVKYRYVKLILFFLSIMLIFYSTALARIENIFYFPAPYKDPSFLPLTIASYIPFLLLLLIVPFISINKTIIKESLWRPFSKWLFTISNFTFSVLIILFFYWGFYNIF